MACGLPEKRATSIRKELEDMAPGGGDDDKVLGESSMSGQLQPKLEFHDVPKVMRQVADIFANQVASRLSAVGDRVEGVSEEDTWPGTVPSG